LYVDAPEAAWTDLDQKWPDLRRSRLFRVQPVLVESLYLRARAALALAAKMAADDDRRIRLLRVAAQDAVNISRLDAPWARPIAQLLEAGLATLSDRPRDAERLLRDARSGFELAGMLLHAAVVRHRAGALVGGPSGEVLAREADVWMTTQGIRDPHRMSAALAPGKYGVVVPGS
jgi:hypothetical protein